MVQFLMSFNSIPTVATKSHEILFVVVVWYTFSYTVFPSSFFMASLILTRNSSHLLQLVCCCCHRHHTHKHFREQNNSHRKNEISFSSFVHSSPFCDRLTMNKENKGKSTSKFVAKLALSPNGGKSNTHAERWICSGSKKNHESDFRAKEFWVIGKNAPLVDLFLLALFIY